MIPGPFTYHRPKSIAEASGLLSQYGDDARVLAGGHSLIPMMKLRMATPEHIIDIAGVGDLKGIARDGKVVTIGAMTTQAELIASDVLTGAVPIIQETSHLIADPQVRYMGTLGGNVANGDPGNDMPAVMMALDASYRLDRAEGSRRVRAREFYFGPYTTAIEPGEIMHSIEIPVPSMGHGYAYQKLKRKIGDYATAAAAVIMTISRSKIVNCSIALTNLADVPLYCEDASKTLIGTSLDKPALVAAAREAGKLMSPSEDGRGPAEYRASVGGVVLTRALQQAFARASH